MPRYFERRRMAVCAACRAEADAARATGVGLMEMLMEMRLSQAAKLRIELRRAGVTREALASICGVSVRAVHRWMLCEESPDARAMPQQRFNEVLYWLARAPSVVVLMLPRSLAAAQHIQSAKRYLIRLQRGPSATTDPNEWHAARVRLATAKLNALYAIRDYDPLCPSDAVLQVSGSDLDPVFVVRGSAVHPV